MPNEPSNQTKPEEETQVVHRKYASLVHQITTKHPVKAGKHQASSDGPVNAGKHKERNP